LHPNSGLKAGDRTILLLYTIYVALPLVIAQIIQRVVIHGVMALVLLTGVFTVSCHTSERLVALLIAIAAVIVRFVEVVIAGQYLMAHRTDLPGDTYILAGGRAFY
jgi:hypothetical protein